MLTTRYKAFFNRILEPLAVRIAGCGISPSVITLLCPFVTALLCVWFVQSRAVLLFCLLMTVVACLDGLDGAVARVSGRVTKLGSYLDAMCDRYVEAMVILAAAIVTGYWILSMFVVVGALLVSYAKARAAMEVSVNNTEWPDLMERTERDVLFIAGLAASAILPWKPLGHDLFWWTLSLLAGLIHLTVLQRMLRARRFIQQRTR